MRYCPWRNRSIDTVDLKKEKHTMRRFIKYLLPALLLALCLSLAACGSGGDTDTDTDRKSVV